MNITVYCGASPGKDTIYRESAIKLGEWIAQNDNTLVYGGGKAGLMGLLADSVIDKNGKVFGIIPDFLVERELAHTKLTNIEIVSNMSERKNKMIALGDVFIALPGGPGTLEEICEVISWARIGQNLKPCILINTNNYYEPLKLMYEKMIEEGFLSEDFREKILFSDDLLEIDSFIKTYVAPEIRKY